MNFKQNESPLSHTHDFQNLMTISSGFLDVYIVECDGHVPMLIPQNIVLSALDTSTQVDHIFWHNLKLPVFSVTSNAVASGVALVIAAEQANERFALICQHMPKSIRLRISEVIDDDAHIDHPLVFKYVRIAEQQYFVPKFDYISSHLGL